MSLISLDIGLQTEWAHSKSGAIKQGQLHDAALSIFLSRASVCRIFSVENRTSHMHEY